MPAHIFASFLIGILIFQISTLSVRPAIPQVAIGSITTASTSPVSLAPTLTRTLAQLSSVERNQYESIVFVGDIMLGRFVEQLMKREGDTYPFQGLSLETLGNKPAIVGNFEASVPPIHIPTPNYQLQFSVPIASLSAFKGVGFTHLSLANNHSFDHGRAGYEHSLAALGEEFVVFGSEKDISEQSRTYLETTAGRVALIGINNSDIGVDTSVITKVLQDAAEDSILQIVYIHWGLEYEERHSRSQKRLATTLVEAGADLIVGHHPHVVQDIDSINGVPVFYSLGNYIFDQYFSRSVQEGLVLSVAIFDNELSIYLHPVSSVGTLSQPHLQSVVNQSQFLNTVAARSHPALAEEIARGKITLPLEFATSSKMAMIDE